MSGGRDNEKKREDEKAAFFAELRRRQRRASEDMSEQEQRFAAGRSQRHDEAHPFASRDEGRSAFWYGEST